MAQNFFNLIRRDIKPLLHQLKLRRKNNMNKGDDQF